jgi:hypothetical protein
VRETAPGVCELEMEMFMAPAIYVPFGIRQMVGGQVRRQLRGVLSSLQQRLNERAAVAAAAAAPAARKEDWWWGSAGRLGVPGDASSGGAAVGFGGWQQPPWMMPWGAPAAGGAGARQKHLQLERQLRQQPPWWSMPIDIVAAA